ncbi:MAG: tripartite tricarboxylate transporter TctB family protein [Gammaproteobacteria bacterium]|jgi:hypothetical protein|nr:tripartite tricarboxylate transporter TctB family protein [Gammaproteobacteria bacterium]
MKKLTPSQWLEVAFWLTFAGLAYVFSFNFSRDIEMYKFGAAGWPRVIIFLIIAAALGQLIQLLLGRGVDARAVGTDTKISTVDVAGQHDTASMIRMGLTFVLPVVYASLLNYTGYYFTTPFFLAGYLYLIGERRAKWLVVVPCVIWVVLTILFTRFLYVGLPVGYWPGFYDFSNWLIVLIR